MLTTFETTINIFAHQSVIPGNTIIFIVDHFNLRTYSRDVE